jgi:hypothetical protein
VFVVTTWHHDQNEPHPEVRFFRNVTMAKEVAHRFMSDFDDGSWDIEEGEYDLWASGGFDVSGEVSVRPIKFEDCAGVQT